MPSRVLAGPAARFITCVAVAVGAVAIGGACRQLQGTSSGQLMLAVTTDMSMPKDVDHVAVDVLASGQKVFSQEYEVGPAGLKIPGTLGILAGKDAAAPVTIRVVAKRGGQPRTIRTVVTTVPQDRIATLGVPIRFLCAGTARTDPADGSVQSTCPPDQSCLAGSCVANAVDSARLPTFDPGAIFGGGTGGGDGACFDTVACLGAAKESPLDTSDCSVALPDGSDPGKINVGLKLPAGGDGFCSATGCFIPLDSDPDAGWTVSGKRIQVVKALCGLLGKAFQATVVVSSACAAKTASVPACGPASSTGGGDGGVIVAPVDGGGVGPVLDSGVDSGVVPGSPTSVTAAPVAVVATVSTLAGPVGGTPGVGGGAAIDGTGPTAQFNKPYGIAADAMGNAYVGDDNNFRLRLVTPAGAVSTLAGSTSGYADGFGPAAMFGSLVGVATDAAGNIYVPDTVSATNEHIRKVSPGGAVTTLAGSTRGFADGLGAAAQFNQPQGVAVDAAGTVYVSDTLNFRIRKVSPAGEVTTLAGSGANVFADGTGTAASFRTPRGIVLDGVGNLYVADDRIRKVTPAGVVTTLAGSGTAGFNDGAGPVAQFSFLAGTGLALDAIGNVYVGDSTNNRIRRVTPGGVVTTLAGMGATSTADGVGASAGFSNPAGIVMYAPGSFYIADRNNSRIRKMIVTGVGQLTVSWSAPNATGSSAITGYTVSAAAASLPAKTCTASASDTTCTFDGLTSGLEYTVEVRAINAVGASAPSASTTGRPN